MIGANVKRLCLVLVLCLVMGSIAGCVPGGDPTESTGPALEVVDYAGNLKLDQSSSTLKQEVTVPSIVNPSSGSAFVSSGFT